MNWDQREAWMHAHPITTAIFFIVGLIGLWYLVRREK